MRTSFLVGVAAMAMLSFPVMATAQTREAAPPVAAQAVQGTPSTPTAPAAESVTPAPAATAASACATRSGAVYFSRNSTTPSQSDRQAVGQLANAGQGCRIDHVTLTGYADASGDTAYNLALSQRRSQAIRDILVTQGVAASAITMEAQGEARASGDSTNDRRVEMQFVLTAAPAAATPGS